MSKHRTQRTMWNRLLSGVLCLALMLGLLPAAGLIQPAQAASWADPYAQKLLEWGVMTPNLANNLDSTITRAEFVAMCNRAFGYKRLGGTPFIDVPYSEWYAEDIDIAYNAGYFTGTSSDPERPTASPNDPLTREMAAVAVARNLMLQEAVGESLGFTDSHELSDWSRGLIATAVAEGVITGYDDGSFRPNTNITRGEVAALLVRLIGTPVNQEGSYEMGSVYGNVTVASSHVTLRNTTIVGNLYVTGGVDLGRVLLENVTVLGRIVISGGGVSDTAQSSVVLRNVAADEMLVDSIIDQFVTISTYGYTDIPLTNVRTSAYLEDASEAGYGLTRIELVGEPGAKLQLAGNIKEVINKTPLSELQLVKGTAQKITIDEYARGSQVLVDTGTLVEEMNLDVATWVYGEGDIRNLNIGAEGCEVDILPENVTIRPGITATVDDQVIGSVAASELSSEPRLLAGYPEVTGIAPTQAEGLFAANKPGTIYWAVSELSRGSVDVEDLITNPVYGGNIFEKQAGSINAANAKTEYGRQIANLVPGGSYYLSAVLVDGRGSRSPLKVVSFTTPDNTVPAFVGDPYMSKETCEIAQVTATANKDCVMYWALLTEGAAAPTPQEFRSGSVGGNSGYGSVSVVKNVPISVKVNRNTLTEKTTYWLYLWLTDLDGVQSMATPVRLEVKTPDETPPIVSAPIQTGVYENTAGVTFSINEAPSTLYWAVVAEGDETFISSSADLTSMRVKIRVENGEGAITFGNTAARGANVETLFTISKLDFKDTQTNNFIMYYVAKDAAGNYSDRVGYIRIRTLDTEPPRVHREFTSVANNDPDQPMADTDIRLVFSEQVKGGSDPSTETSGSAPVTFLDFYNQVLATAGNATTQQAAKNALAEELAKHIKLYYCPATGSPYALTPKGSQNANDDNWVIDWHNAVITMDSEGQVIITLPSGGQNPALQLDSGATYYFQFLDVFDNAYKPNGLEGNRLGNWTLPRFTTVYAQVDFWPNTGVSKVTNSSDGSDDIRLDIVLDISPRSTEKVPLSEYWDLIMWSDTVMTVDVYRQVVSKDNETNIIEQWHQVRSDVTFGYVGAGRGLRELLDPENYETVQKGLEQKNIYRYGVHVKELGTKEEDPKSKPESWSDLVTMHFSLIAGNSGDVSDVSIRVNTRTNADTNYNNYLKSGSIKEIGTWNSPEDGPVNLLRGTKQFTDTRAPSFVDIYPQFIPGSGSITMEVMLDRPGTVYYVVAPVERGIGTSADGKTMIGLGNDGRRGSTLAGKTYIPTGGNDIEGHENEIHFISGGSTDEAKRYSSPDYLQIYNGTVTGASIRVGDPLEIKSANVVNEVTISNLDPLKAYYVYIVLEGGGDPSKVVQIYRVDTLEAKAPSVTVSGTGSSATMTPSDDCLMYFVLVQTSALDPNINRYLEQMSTLYDENSTTGPSVFDVTASPSVKSQVAQYILSRSDASILRWELPKDTDAEHPFPNGYVPGNQGVVWDFNKNMDVEKGSYVVLVMVKQVRAGDSGDDYGFGAFSGLRKRDDVPPALFLEADMKEGVVLLTQTKAEENAAQAGNGYSGSLQLLFDKNIYYWTGTAKYTLSYDRTDSAGKKAIMNVIGGTVTMATTKSGDINRTIDLKLTDISKNDRIILFEDGGLICNSDNYPAGMLVLTFDPEIPVTEVYKSAVTTSNEQTTLKVPGFRVSWG